MTTATKEKPASTPSAVTVTEAKEKCKAAAIAHVESGQPIGDDMPIPFDVIQLLAACGLTGPWWLGMCKTLARRKGYVDKLPDINALRDEADEKQAEADMLEPTAIERIRKAKEELRKAEVAFHDTVSALRSEAQEIDRAAGRAYTRDFDERFMEGSAPYELAKAAGAGDTESREKMFCDWTCVGIGKSGDDFRIECMRRRDTSDGSKQKTLAETLDPYSSY